MRYQLIDNSVGMMGVRQVIAECDHMDMAEYIRSALLSNKAADYQDIIIKEKEYWVVNFVDDVDSEVFNFEQDIILLFNCYENVEYKKQNTGCVSVYSNDELIATYHQSKSDPYE